jgi:hypothetical protein
LRKLKTSWKISKRSWVTARKKAAEHVHHGRSRGEQVVAVDGVYWWEAVQEEERAVEVLDPVAGPERAGVIADDGEHEECPGEQDA